MFLTYDEDGNPELDIDEEGSTIIILPTQDENEAVTTKDTEDK